ncbi:MAG: hypothetical protein P0S96_05995 [Simkaniaceae bacterium]|nr:hypothetical protein [Candidatus Sacchlamyda saccharinae]
MAYIQIQWTCEGKEEAKKIAKELVYTSGFKTWFFTASAFSHIFHQFIVPCL